MEPDDLSEQERLIKGHAERMQQKGVPNEQIADFVRRAQGRLAQNDAERPLDRTQLAKGMARGIGQGLTFNFADELEGMARSAFSDRSYDEVVGDVRQDQNTFRDKEPALAMASEIAGSVVPGLGTARLALAGSKGAARVGRVAASGAGAGGLAGAGSGEGNALDRLPSAGGGAALGGLVGAGAGQVVKRIGAPLVAKAAERAAQTPSASPFSALAQQIATRPEATAPAVNGGIRRLASSLTADDLERAAASPDSPESMVLDLTGKTGIRQARGIRTLGGKPGENIDNALEARHAGQGNRLVRGTGGDRVDAFTTIEDLTAAREKAAGPLYDEFRAAGVLDPDRHPELGEIVKLPLVEKAIRAVKGESVRLSKLPDTHPDVLDAAYKRTGEAAFSAKLGYNPAETQRDFKRILDAASGGKYSPALEAFAGPSKMMEAVTAGQRAFHPKVTDSEIRAAMKGLTESERELYKRGAIDSIRQRIENVGSHRDLTNLFNNPNFKKSVVAVYGKDADEVLKLLDVEKNMAGANTAIRGGSQTADKMADAVELSPETRSLFRNLTHGEFGQAAGKALEAGGRRVLRVAGEKTRGQLGKALTTRLTDREGVSSLAAAIRELERQGASGRVGSSVGGSAGGRATSGRP